MTSIRRDEPIEVGVANDRRRKTELVYHLLPFSRDEIRVIKLQPATSLLTPVIADLAVLQLGIEPSQYDALSYGWSDDTDLVNIIINGRGMNIARSLQIALRYLRHDEEERVLWADSLCINQGDMEEKSIQIQKMDRIYKAGMALLNSYEALQDETTTTQKIMHDEEGVTGLTGLLLRPYWSRMWMFQEILLAKRVAVHCGTFVADWWTIKTLDTLTSKPSLWKPSEPRKRSIAELRKAFFNIAHLNVPLSQSGNIENILFPTSHLQASNDHDKLYALIGLRNIGDYLTIDYHLSTSDFYADFTQCYTQHTGGLSLLYGAGLCQSSRGRDIGLPSWVPDFRGIDGRDSFFLAAGFSRVFEASAGRSYRQAERNDFEMGSDNNIHPAEGLQLDVVVGEPPIRRLSIEQISFEGSAVEQYSAKCLDVEGLLAGEILMTHPLDVSEAGRWELYQTFGIGCSRHSSCESAIQALAEVLVMDSDAKNSKRISGQPDHGSQVSLFRLLGLVRDVEKLCKGDSTGAEAETDVLAFLRWLGIEQVDMSGEIYSSLWASEQRTLDRYRTLFIRELKRKRVPSCRIFSVKSGYIDTMILV
ncbi:ankyrin and HET domain-containing protein [Colletotrichum melonis]|uniref:Ankyrin and HET domain-containing protein n=1 Tax=Colletotrichum melonis TaxID=1209925 RepID=A0AAI9V6U7_9PEZI|nr:ankyrin and HET domain-containing protein [Colletotrichum melonis]